MQMFVPRRTVHIFRIYQLNLLTIFLREKEITFVQVIGKRIGQISTDGKNNISRMQKHYLVIWLCNGNSKALYSILRWVSYG